jgi:outer membrane protein OmpA-like peptidoglycan-associated protein
MKFVKFSNMSKKLLLLLGILATIIAGALLYWKYVCDCGGGAGTGKEVAAGKTVAEVPQVQPTAVAPAVADSTLRWTVIMEKYNASPITAYFKVNSTVVELSDTERQKVRDLKDYIDNVSGAAVTVTGHSDITGGHELNMRLGQARAEALKIFLIKEGITGDRIACNSRGPDEPAADNSTPEGRARNRRAVAIINK